MKKFPRSFFTTLPPFPCQFTHCFINEPTWELHDSHMGVHLCNAPTHPSPWTHHIPWGEHHNLGRSKGRPHCVSLVINTRTKPWIHNLRLHITSLPLLESKQSSWYSQRRFGWRVSWWQLSVSKDALRANSYHITGPRVYGPRVSCPLCPIDTQKV